MATKTSGQKGGLTMKLPDTLTLKDLITIVSVAVSLTVAWGVFSTRITVLEKEVVAMEQANQARGANVEQLQKQVRRLEAHQQDDELIIDQVFSILKRPSPTRRAQD